MIPIIEKIRENNLRWFDHVIRIGDLKAARVNMKINVEGKKGGGSEKEVSRQKTKFHVKS